MNTQFADNRVAGQPWDAQTYARNGRFVADFGAAVVDWLAPQRGERILDLGCGDGVLTQQIAASGAHVFGVDASENLAAAARELGIEVRVIDAHALQFDNEFDAVFSNAALHWMKRDPAAVVAGVHRALKPGGRFVAEMGAAGNVASIRGAIYDALSRRGIEAVALDPWYFPTAVEYRSRLERAGFTVRRLETFPRPTPLPGDVTSWLRTFASAFMQAVPADQREAVFAEIRERLRTSLNNSGVWTADYVRLRFIACK